MKLYAKIESERLGRPVKKGGNEVLYIELSVGNRVVYVLKLNEQGMLSLVDSNGYTSSVGWKQYQRYLEWQESKVVKKGLTGKFAGIEEYKQ